MLTVYRASAGSGKTFTLAVEYIKLLVQNPMAYRHTLAVTFTNKATEEMKMRILSQLFGIWQQLPASRDYTAKVCSELGVTPGYAASQAGKALTLLLHNYSYFRVETIDSFFQSVLRNLARELDLTANLRVELNDAQVEDQAVDEMIDSLQKSDKMLTWLLRYIMETIGDDRSWNVIGQIKQFGLTIFRDYYKQQSRELNAVLAQDGFIDDYARTLQALRAKSKARMQSIADDFFDAIGQEGLTIDDFSGKNRGVCSIFIKLQRGEMDEGIITKTVADAVGDPSKWYTKTSPRAPLIHALTEGRLGSLLRQAVEEQPRQWRLFKSADLTLRHLSQLRLLNSIETRVRQMNEEANRFLLSDTQQLLHDVIDGSDSPFIFEKTGAQLEHIMIDEFQDTSTVQWKNFKVLLHETLSHQGGSGLIVGDVKQSIYRWRSGDWRLLAGIQDEMGATQPVTVKKLDTNYRSEPRIIGFNNAFFAEAARTEGVAAYDDVCQQWPQGKAVSGHVEVTLLPAEGYAEAMLAQVANCVEQLVGSGARPQDIAILVRNNAHIPLLANYLLETLPGIDVVSDEAFRLDASPAVQLLVTALRYIAHRDDVIARAFLAKAAGGSIDAPLPPAFADHLEELSRLPLYELAEQVQAIFANAELSTHNSQLLTPNSQLLTLNSHSAYLCAFYDKLSDYVNQTALTGRSGRGPIDDFLHYWEETLCKTTIQSPETTGLRIISIHKSKGLEFPHVIIPFCDWRLEHSDILWCRPAEEPFSRLPLAPIDYSAKGMKGTIYESDYDEEHQQTLVDNLNLLYVAFTRASSNLYVLGRRGGKTSRSALIEQVLLSPDFAKQLNKQCADGQTAFALEGAEDGAAPLHFSYGQQTATDAHPAMKEADGGSADSKSANPFLQKSQPVIVEAHTYSSKTPLGQSNQSARFAAGEEDEAAPADTYIQLGSVLHDIFSTIRTRDDIPQALLLLEQEGIIYDEQITRQRLEQLIRKRLDDPRVAEWFAPHWTLYTECSILTPDGRNFRPDRVMTDGRETIVVDFKFGRERDGYHDQVRQYMSLLSAMGLPGVKGYLWFVYSNKIVPVNP